MNFKLPVRLRMDIGNIATIGWFTLSGDPELYIQYYVKFNVNLVMFIIQFRYKYKIMDH